MLLAVRLDAGPLSHAGEGKLAKLWSPLEAFPSNMLVLAGQIQPALLFLGNEAISQVCKSYFMEVFVGQSLFLGPHKSCGSDWEHTGTVCSQTPSGE